MPRGVPFDGAERDALRTKVAHRYRTTVTTVGEIARDEGWSYGLVRDLLVEAGVALPTRGRRAGKSYGAHRRDDVLTDAYGERRDLTDDEIDDEVREHLGGSDDHR